MEPSASVSQTAASAETATEMALSSPRKQRAAKEDARKAAAAQKELRQQAMLPADDEDKDKEEIAVVEGVKVEEVAPAPTGGAVAVAGPDPDPQYVTLYKPERSQKFGIRFFSYEETKERAAKPKGKAAPKIPMGAFVAMTAEDGAAHECFFRGERIVSIGGWPIEGPQHCAEVLRESEGYVRVGVLPPLPGFDVSMGDNEEVPPATPRDVPTPREQAGKGKPPLSARGEGDLQRWQRESLKLHGDTTSTTSTALGDDPMLTMPKLDLDAARRRQERVDADDVGTYFTSPRGTPQGDQREEDFSSMNSMLGGLGGGMFGGGTGGIDLMETVRSFYEIKRLWRGDDEKEAAAAAAAAANTPRTPRGTPRTPGSTPRAAPPKATPRQEAVQSL